MVQQERFRDDLYYRISTLSDGDRILPRHLPPEICGAQPREALADAVPCGEIVPLAQLEERYLRAVVERFEGGRRELADRLGVSERTLYRKLSGLVGTEGGA